MWLNYLKTSWRQILKQRGYSFLNISGLATGLAAFILITLFITDEISFEKWNPNADRIYRVEADVKMSGNQLNLAVSADPMGYVLKKDYPQVENYARIFTNNSPKMIRKGDDFIHEDKVVHADSTWFDLFPLQVIAGDLTSALDEPNAVVVTRSGAEKYFNSTDIVGRILETKDNERTDYKVTAVVEDVPSNTHYHYDFFFSMDNVTYGFGDFLSNNFYTYVMLKPGIDHQEFNKNFEDVLEKYVLPQAKQLMQISSMEEFRSAGNQFDYFLTPITRIHLHSSRFPELEVNGNIQYVYIFSAVALFLLFIACINFMNLATARSATRAREVGVRKVLGTARGNLLGQFFSESILISFVSMSIALILVYLLLGLFNNLAGKDFSFTNLLTPGWLLTLFLLPLLVGLLAGLYPAVYLSSFRPITVLKSKYQGRMNKSRLRSTLVIFQFATSIALIIGAGVVYKQLHYIQSKNIGFNKDQVLIINNTDALSVNVDGFRNEISQLPGVKGSTYAGYLPVMPSGRNTSVYFKDLELDLKKGLSLQHWTVESDYLDLLDMELVTGRNFSKEFGTDSTAIILNETAVKLLGYTDDPINKKIYGGEGLLIGKPQEFHVIGVVKDFNFSSLRDEIGPLCLFYGKSPWATAFKVETSDLAALVQKIKNTWNEFSPAIPFNYSFMDDNFNQMYRAEVRVGRIAVVFSILAIFIACLGLFGLGTYLAEQRKKEIGIRKVLGATEEGLVGLLSGDFIKLVLIAFTLGAPLAWYLMHRWLEDFAFRAPIGIGLILGSGLLAVLIALLTVSYQALTTALANPVDSLRNE